MLKHYYQPTSKILESKMEILATSKSESKRKIERHCDELCKLWHICQDRRKNKQCSDKKYKWE